MQATKSCIYPNQIKAANDIVEHFKAGKSYTLLLAEMQSGKSDTFMFAGSELVRAGVIDQFVVFSGNAETSLRDQAKNQKDFWRKYRKFLRKLVDDDDETADRVEDTWSEKSVIWASDLLKWVRPPGRTLFIWDESHFAQSGPSEQCAEGNRPYKFFAKHGLSVDGSAHGMPGNLMLSVSATPFSEVIANGETSSKPVVYMKPGVGYRGLNQMMIDDQIVPYDVGSLESVFTRLALEVKDEGVGIVRATGSKAEDLERTCKELGVLVKVHDITDSNDINWYLGGGPQNHSLTGVIIVKGKVKMGKQLGDKSRIRWCMETSVCSNTDTFLQGLAGRCMGYLESGTHKGTKIYVSAKYCLKGDHEKYITMMEHFSSGGECDSRLELPTRAMNVVAKPTSAGGPIYAPTIPERKEIDIRGWDAKNPEQSVKTLVHPHLKGCVSEDDFLLTSPNNKSVKRWEEKHGKNYVDAMHSASQNKLPFKCPFPQLNHQAKVWVVGCPAARGDSPKVFASHVKDLCREGKTHMVVYVQYRGVEQPAKEVSYETTGDEVFSNQPKVSETIEDNGSGAYVLCHNTSSSVQEMTSALDFFVQQTTSTKSPSSVKVRRYINSNVESGWKGIAVTSEVFANLKPGGEIYEQILGKWNVKLSVRKNGNSNPKRFPEKCIRLSSISW